MCGIAGAFGQSNKSTLTEMVSCIGHRGPDDTGFFVDADVMLANARLSIIDLEGGDQPVSNEAGDVQVVCNGEIYNYPELKKTLRNEGHTFSSAVDVEVIPHLYEEYGPDFVDRLNGMFAIAIWDASEEKLLLYRDHVGIKPLYYAWFNGSVYFGSELKSILQAGIPRIPDTTGLSYYWNLDYIPAPHSAIEDIHKVRPGEYLEFSEKGQQNYRYWRCSREDVITNNSGEPYSAEFYASRIRDHLNDSISRRLLADVPVGAFLSGGLDSSTVVGLMSEISDGPVRTYSVAFENSEHDESEYSRFVADHFDTDHTEYTLSLDDAEMVPKILRRFDEPLSDPATIPTSLLAEKASQNVKVVNTGSGADELFAGYDRYLLDQKYWNLFKPIPNPAKHIAKLAAKFAPETSQPERYLEYLGCTTSQENALVGMRLCESPAMLAGNDEADQQGLVGQSFEARDDFLRNMTRFDVETWLPGDLLVKVDRTTMQHGLEARTPFLDKELVNFAARIPSEMKLGDGTQKYILKKSVEDVVPQKISNREKDAFNVPIEEWLTDSDSPLQSRFTPVALDPIGFLDTDEVVRRYESLKSGNSDYARLMWKVLNLQVWHETYIQDDLS